MANPILQLLEALRNMFTCDIGIDLGTANTLVYMKGRGIIIREPSVVAVDARTDELRVRCVGHEAKAIIGAAPNSILAVRPLKDGVIADFDITAAMLQSFIRQACGSRLFVRPRVVIELTELKLLMSRLNVNLTYIRSKNNKADKLIKQLYKYEKENIA